MDFNSCSLSERQGYVLSLPWRLGVFGFSQRTDMNTRVIVTHGNLILCPSLLHCMLFCVGQKCRTPGHELSVARVSELLLCLI